LIIVLTSLKTIVCLELYDFLFKLELFPQIKKIFTYKKNNESKHLNKCLRSKYLLEMFFMSLIVKALGRIQTAGDKTLRTVIIRML
jgi:hypothetical protein